MQGRMRQGRSTQQAPNSSAGAKGKGGRTVQQASNSSAGAKGKGGRTFQQASNSSAGAKGKGGRKGERKSRDPVTRFDPEEEPWECDRKCGFSNPDFAVAEAHERACSFGAAAEEEVPAATPTCLSLSRRCRTRWFGGNK